jgi:histidyl-tRNA synthetase
MSNDLEMLETLSTLLDAIIEPSTYTIKINHKNIVIELLKIVGVPTELFQTVFSSLDKLDKKSFDDIKIELAQKGLDDNLIQTLETFYNEILQTHTTNLSQFELTIQKLQKLGICDETISKYFHLINTFLQKIKLNNFILDPFLIRGMDYYTGLIFEVAYNNKTIMESTISAGGRYDNMIGKFSTRGDIPAIGMSLGVERLVRILEQTKFKDVIFAPVPDIFVATVGKNMVVDRIVLCNKLRNLGYYTISSDLAEPDMRQQFAIVFEKYQKSIPVMIVIGENEVKSNTLTIKDVNKKKQFSIENDDRLIKQAIDNILNAPKS